VLDAAHGGDDSGAALSSGQAEKSLTLAFAVKLRSLLAARGMTVVITRDSDQTLPPNQRAEIANRAQAQACLSLHFSDTGSGVHLFASDLPAVPAAHFVPWKTAQSIWVNRSLALTGALNAALQQASLPVTLGRTALAGIDSMACPAVAIEIAPERTPGSAAVKSVLSNPNYQSRVAEALAAALLVWRSEARQP
jgi:N-acetylmuramoyl-L-alanine amidase